MFFTHNTTIINGVVAIASQHHDTKDAALHTYYEFLNYNTNPSVLPTIDYYLALVLDANGNKVVPEGHYVKPVEPEPEEEEPQEEPETGGEE